MSINDRLIDTTRNIMAYLLPDCVYYNDLPLPSKFLRLCGEHFRENSDYLASAKKEATRLITNYGLTHDSEILDFGCGVGRLAVGIISTLGEIRGYKGIDVCRRSIRWCERHIAAKHPGFHFAHLSVKNARYNPRGQELSENYQLPFENDHFDIIYAYSVFSHMTTNHLRIYLQDFERILRPSGKIFLTAFVAEGVPEMQTNPKNFKKKWRGPLHCVLYEKAFFITLLSEKGFAVEQMDYEKETDAQTGFRLVKIT